MRKLVTCLAAASLLAANTAFAGGLSDEVMEAPVVVEEPMMEPAGSSVSPTLIVVGILAALLLASSLSEDEDISSQASDMRLKENITHLGSGFNGLPIYSFSYIGQEGTYLGVMAQDVLAHTPEAVVIGEDGYMSVNYHMLGMGMVKLN